MQINVTKLSIPFSILFLFSVICFLVAPSLSGQTARISVKFNNLSIKDGLSQSSPNCIFQDSRGLMWIGTEDGLNKYDGYSFIVYKPDQKNPFSISNSRILSIAEDQSGNLWIGTNGGGLNKYDRKSDRFFQFLPGKQDSLSVAGPVINCILPLPNGEIWIGTENGLSIFRMETGNFLEIAREYPELQALSEIPVKALTPDKNSMVYAGTSKGLFQFNIKNRSLDHFSHNPQDVQSLPSDKVTALMVDREARLWIGMETELARMERAGSFILIRSSAQKEANVPAVPIKALLQDDEGDIWIGTFGKGLDILSARTGNSVNYSYDHNNPYSLKNNEVLSLFKDFSGIVWVGTNGLDTYNPKKEKFILYDYVPFSREKLVFRNIHPIYEDEGGILWIGSKSDGLHVLDRTGKTYSRWTHNPDDLNSLSSNRIRAIREFPEGVLWIGTDDQGLNTVSLDANRRPVRYKRFKSEPDNANSLTSNRIYSFFTDNSGKL